MPFCHACVSGEVSPWSVGKLTGGEGREHSALAMGRSFLCWPRGSKLPRLKHKIVHIPGFIVSLLPIRL